MLAHSTLFGRTSCPTASRFFRLRATSSTRVGSWFRTLFWAIGAFSLFGSAMGIIDYTSRLAADVLKSTYLPRARVSESRLYFGLVWGLVAIGCTILLVGAAQPIVLLVISASVGGGMMFLYSGLLIAINRRGLPAPIQVRSYRLASLVWATLLFGALAGITIWEQVGR